MAAKKKKIKLSKKHRKQGLALAKPILAGLLGLAVGLTASKLVSARATPTNLVWATESSVKIPSDLRQFLLDRDDCHNYRGPGTPTGVGLWGVYQVSQGKFAKVAYGCSWNLSNYIMAVKSGKTWQLIPPKDYFAPFKDTLDASKGALPYCSVLEKYKIPKTIEGFCIKPDGSAQSNQQ